MQARLEGLGRSRDTRDAELGEPSVLGHGEMLILRAPSENPERGMSEAPASSRAPPLIQLSSPPSPRHCSLPCEPLILSCTWHQFSDYPGLWGPQRVAHPLFSLQS